MTPSQDPLGRGSRRPGDSIDQLQNNDDCTWRDEDDVDSTITSVAAYVTATAAALSSDHDHWRESTDSNVGWYQLEDACCCRDDSRSRNCARNRTKGLDGWLSNDSPLCVYPVSVLMESWIRMSWQESLTISVICCHSDVVDHRHLSASSDFPSSFLTPLLSAATS